MSGDFILGIIAGVCGLFAVAVLAGPETIRTATERGFYTYENQLYVVRKAQPSEVPAS